MIVNPTMIVDHMMTDHMTDDMMTDDMMMIAVTGTNIE